MAKGYPQLALDPVWRDRILELVREEGVTSRPIPLEDPEEKLLPRLALLYGTLRRIGLSEERTKECLQANQRLDIEEAFEWVCSLCYSNRA